MLFRWRGCKNSQDSKCSQRSYRSTKGMSTKNKCPISFLCKIVQFQRWNSISTSQETSVCCRFWFSQLL
uniref:Uncharacterized protein n=1 Tax=Arundo donax TaxID=35708 RepID=A0A0A9F4S8_ARUDO